MNRKPSNKTCHHCGAQYVGKSQSKYCGDACLLRHHITIDERGCWLWPANRSNGRYGIAKAGNVATVMAHRLAYETFIGPIGDQMVMHRCDVKLCINPDHLCLGTAADNSSDMVAKGRQCRGARSPRAKLTEAQAKAIWRDQRSWKSIASTYGVSKSAVMLIKTKRNWSHIHGAL